METSRDVNSLPLTINLLHGEGLKNSNPCTTTQVYVKAHIKDTQKKKKTKKKTMKTKIDKCNGTNPIWNSEMKFNVNHEKLLGAKNETLELVFEVKSSSPFSVLGNTKLGQVRLPVKNLYERVAAENMVAWTSMRCPIDDGGSSKFKGALYFSYRFGIYEEDERAVVVGAAASAPPLLLLNPN